MYHVGVPTSLLLLVRLLGRFLPPRDLLFLSLPRRRFLLSPGSWSVRSPPTDRKLPSDFRSCPSGHPFPVTQTIRVG